MAKHTNGFEMQNHKNVPIIIIEESDLDEIGLEWALRQSTINNSVTRVSRCNEAVAMLQDPKAPYYGKPIIVLLDFDMPMMDGHKFLAEVKNDPCTKDVIIFVFSESGDWVKRMAIFDSQVAGFIQKSNTAYQQFAEQLKQYFEKTPLFAA